MDTSSRFRGLAFNLFALQLGWFGRLTIPLFLIVIMLLILIREQQRLKTADERG